MDTPKRANQPVSWNKHYRPDPNQRPLLQRDNSSLLNDLRQTCSRMRDCVDRSHLLLNEITARLRRSR